MEDAIILYPSPGRSHLVSMVELGKLILTHHPSFSVVILISDAPFETGSTAPYIAAVSASTPSITFHQLPTIPLPNTASSIAHVKTLSFELPTLNNPNLHKELCAISKSSNIKALIIDFFCYNSFQVSNSLNIPAYFYITGGLTALTAFLYLPTLHKKFNKSFKELDELLNIPGIPPFLAKKMPLPMLDRSQKVYHYFLEAAIKMPKSAGIVVNATEALEQRALNAIRDGLCTPGEPVPPIYCVGPLLVASNEGEIGGGKEHECLIWLNSQPSRSVLFLSFGSWGKFSAKQLEQMAIGLENSGVRFLWVVRAPPEENETKSSTAAAEPSMGSFLPEGFLERTKNRGFVMNGWAPQVTVLSHDSVGGFVTNCGWNSALESVRAGVPMLAWPQYADQNLNAVAFVEEMKVALAVSETEDGLVSAVELEKRVIELMMDSETRKGLQERVMAIRDVLLEAMSDDGPSRAALAKLAESISLG